MNKQILTHEELSVMLGCGTSGLSDLRNKYGLPCHKAGKRVFYLLHEIMEWVSSLPSPDGGSDAA